MILKAICQAGTQAYTAAMPVLSVHKQKVTAFLSDKMHYGPGHLGNTTVHKWMDIAKGSGHRLKHRHSLENLPKIIKRFGWRGVPSYFTHLTQDFFTPDGIPIIPKAWQAKQKLAQFGLSPRVARDLVSLTFAEFAVALLILVPVATIVKEMYLWNKYDRPARAAMKEAGLVWLAGLGQY